VWKQLADKAEDDREVMSSYLDGKALLTGVLRLYAAVHRHMHETLQQDETASKDEFREQRRRKRNPSDDKIQIKRKNVTQDPKALPQVAVRNFFAPLRTQMETEDNNGEMSTGTEKPNRSQQTRQVGRLPSSLPPRRIFYSCKKK
jgi:hypothetical protein